ncbi:MAG: hypothetical protein KA004_04830 [Verrucomicrobiales bacterium]|nr:hypothetical protein [Verrucomicrobiales bacterium]
MNPILIDPIDTFFFRDSIPMSAGQGRGAGARLPLPSTLHEAFRASLLEKSGRSGVTVAFRPKDAPRKGGWLGKGKSVTSRGSKDFQSLQLSGPFPYLEVDSKNPQNPSGLFFPLPLDLLFAPDDKAHLLALRTEPSHHHSAPLPALAVSPVPPRKDQPTGFLSARAMESYLQGNLSKISPGDILPWSAFYEPEYRIGVELDPSTNSAAKGQLYAATHARPHVRFRLAAWVGLKNPAPGEADRLAALDRLLLGGEQRMARLHAQNVPFSAPPLPTFPDEPGPQIVKWTLATSAVFAHGWLPGWCRDSEGKGRPDGEVCLKLAHGRARLIAVSAGKPLAFAGWDVVEQCAKPTRLAVHAGAVYYFLCENTAAARDLSTQLHWRPRSDFYGEKGFGFGFASPHPMSPDIQQLAGSLFKI